MAQVPFRKNRTSVFPFRCERVSSASVCIQQEHAYVRHALYLGHTHAGLLLRHSVQHVLLREQDDPAGDALQPQSPESGPVAIVGENGPSFTRNTTPSALSCCGCAVTGSAGSSDSQCRCGVTKLHDDKAPVDDAVAALYDPGAASFSVVVSRPPDPRCSSHGASWSACTPPRNPPALL